MRKGRNHAAMKKINFNFDMDRFLDSVEEKLTVLSNTVTLGRTILGRTRKNIEAEIRRDVKAIRDRDPAARSDLEVMLLYSGLHAILAYRVAHKLYVSDYYLPARMISQLAKTVTGIEIHPGATIGKSLVIDHGSGVVIGETAELGDNCTLYQGVTLGGTGKDTGKRHPTLGNHVMVGAGAKILGPVRIGDFSKIAAGAVVLNDIPENSTAVGIPAKVVRKNGERMDDLDQVHVGDPVGQELSRMRSELKELKTKVDKIESSK